MPELRLGIPDHNKMAASAEHGRQSEIHHEAADKQISKAKKNVSMAKHPASAGRNKEFVSAASSHLKNAQEYANKAKYHKSQSNSSMGAQYGGTMMGRSANFESGRANAGNN